MDKQLTFTKEGLEKLKAERENLIQVERPKVIEEIAIARSQGDLSENADYTAAREKQAHLEARIKEIDNLLMHATIIDESELANTETVKLGCTVTILDLSNANPFEEKYTIVGTFETDPFSGKISKDSPLAKAVTDHRVDDVVTVGVAEPYDVKIVNIEYLS